MRRKCKHPKWNEHSVRFSPPTARLTKANGDVSPSEIAIFIYGMSTVTQTCAVCDFARSYTVAGDARTREPAREPAR